jgi:tetratricopeptide (TPR) repeat protein
MLWLQRQEYERAAEILGKAAAIKPRDAVIRTQLGQALERMGNSEAALEQYLEALDNEPGSRDANYLAARMLLANHQPAEALARLELAWQIEDKQSPRYLALGAAVYAWLGEGDSADRKLEQSIALRNGLASGQQVSVEKQSYARHALGLVLAADMTSANFPLQLGVMLEHLGNTDDARIHYREAVNRDIDHREANFMLGRSLVAIGRHREAITCLNRNIDPDNRLTPAILGILATAFEESGESGKAFETLEYASWLAGSHGDLSLAKTLERRARKIEYIMQNTPQE